MGVVPSDTALHLAPSGATLPTATIVDTADQTKVVAVTDLDELKILRDHLKETIRRSADRAAAGSPERYLSEHDKAERQKLLATLEADILRLGPH